jgi:hypothetical protein
MDASSNQGKRALSLDADAVRSERLPMSGRLTATFLEGELPGGAV